MAISNRRLSRAFRRQRRNVEEIGQQADKSIDRLLLRRLNRLTLVRRFVFLWLAVVFLLFTSGIIAVKSLNSYYQVIGPVPGGIYSEGVVGSFTNANPIYASGEADRAISQLVFSGLLKYDQNDKLAGDLASSWSIDPSQTIYTVHLRQGVKWQDGSPFSSADVVFTFKTIQSIEAQSPLFSSWQGIKVSAKGPNTVIFSLPNPLSSFPQALTIGIIPQHLLGGIPPAELRSADFNTHPIGTGPFEWRYITITGGSDVNRQQQITLGRFNNYFMGQPKLDEFQLQVFRSDGQMVNAFKAHQISAMAGLAEMPPALAKDSSVNHYETPLNAIVMAFFNTSKPILGDKVIRQALVSSVDRTQLVNLFNYPPTLVNGPILPAQVNYAKLSGELRYNLKFAEQLLNHDGWILNANGIRHKGKTPLSINLTSESSANYETLTQFLQAAWSKLGVQVTITNRSSADIQGSVVPNHDYDVLVYGIDVGVDPDVFAYWDSSQASLTSQGHLNLSEYQSQLADQALGAARTRANLQLRIPKYQNFTKQWRADAPALALYQPNFLYISRGKVYGYERKAMGDAADRFYNVANWEIRTARTTIK